MKEYIDNLLKSNEYLEKEIELKKGVYGKFASFWKDEEEIKKNNALIKLFEKIISIPKKNFDIPSKILHPTIRMNDGEIFLEFSFDDKIFGDLYSFYCNSSSSLYDETKTIIKELFFQVWGDMPFLNTNTECFKEIERNCDYFYNDLIKFLKFLQNDEYAKIILETIDNMYLRLIEECKKRAEG